MRLRVYSVYALEQNSEKEAILNLEPDTNLMQTQCKSCPFQADGIKLGAKKMSEIIEYLIQGVNHFCHSDETHHTICRGGRDYQLEIWHRQSIIKEPTDDALCEAMIGSGINPQGHIKRGYNERTKTQGATTK